MSELEQRLISGDASMISPDALLQFISRQRWFGLPEQLQVPTSSPAVTELL